MRFYKTMGTKLKFLKYRDQLFEIKYKTLSKL